MGMFLILPQPEISLIFNLAA